MNASLTAPSPLPPKRPLALLPLRLSASLAGQTVVLSLEGQSEGHFICEYIGDSQFGMSDLVHIFYGFQFDLVSVVYQSPELLFLPLVIVLQFVELPCDEVQLAPRCLLLRPSCLGARSGQQVGGRPILVEVLVVGKEGLLR